MNYSFNKTRVLSLAACTVLCATMFTGCFSKNDPAPSTEATGGLNLVNPTETTEAPTTATTEATEPATTEAPKKANVAVVKEKAPVRSAPTTDSNVLSQLNIGDEVEVNRVESNGGTQWAYIPLKGWVDTQYLDMSSVTVGGATSTPAGTTTTPAATNATTATTATTPTTSNNTNTNTGTTGNATITATTLNIRETPDNAGKIVGGYVKGEKVTILETSNGWGRTNRGWISMTYVSQNGTTGTTNNTTNTTTNTTNEKVIDRGLVLTNALNVRSNAGTGYNSVSSYGYLTRVEIVEEKDVDGTTWGRTKDGWISLDYVYIDGTRGDDAATGTVTGSAVNVRSGPGTRYNVVGSVSQGDTLDILAQYKIGNTTWGCISSGWVSMDYVETSVG